MNLLLINGKIKTFDKQNKTSEAIGVRGNYIDFVGKTEKALSFRSSKTIVIDLEGKLVVPGLIDAHNHMMVHGTNLLGINLQSENVRSINDILNLVKIEVDSSAPGKWIRGFGYDHTLLKENRHPTRKELDTVSPNNPVVLFRSCLHMLVANSQALLRSGVNINTIAPKGGVIGRDELSGEPSGLFKEAAQDLIKNSINPYTVNEMVKGLAIASEQYVKEGLTSVHEAGVGYLQSTADEMSAYQRALQQERLKVRVGLYIMHDLMSNLTAIGFKKGFGNNMLKMLGVKVFLDGAYSIHTAALNEPYSNDLSNKGMLSWTPDELQNIISEANNNDLQVAVHAIGDRAIDLILEVYERVLGINPKKSHRHRIEHFLMANQNQIRKAVDLGLVIMSNPSEILFYGDTLNENIGLDRSKNAFPLKSIISAGLPVALGSDRPCCLGNPLITIQSAMLRKTRSGSILGDDQKISLDEAFRAYTINSAFLSFEEQIKGSIEEGKFADLTVFAEDLYEIPIEELAEVPVEYTVVNGKIVYSN